MPVCVQEKRARRVNSARLFILLDFDCEGVSHDAGSNMLARERMQVGFVSQHHFTAGCAKPPNFGLVCEDMLTIHASIHAPARSSGGANTHRLWHFHFCKRSAFPHRPLRHFVGSWYVCAFGSKHAQSYAQPYLCAYLCGKCP